MENWDGTERRKSDSRHAEIAIRMTVLDGKIELLKEKLDNLKSAQEGVLNAFVKLVADHVNDDKENFRILFKHLYLGMGGLAVVTVLMRFLFR